MMNATTEGPRGAQDQRVSADALFDSLYPELHRLAQRELNRRRRPVAGPGVTTVLHEAYLRMAARDAGLFVDHARFMAYVARVMRALIIDDLRRNRSHKRGGLYEIVALGADYPDGALDSHSLVRINEALDELAAIEPNLAAIIDLKFFCGFSFTDIAVMQGVSERTIQRNWQKARLYLHHAICEPGPAVTSRYAATQP